ncbi:hypothetical protein K437DRAFT_259048 [Tilletiaria anomala UBC 951]|uniref:Leo1-domain-containing protein n=1 Tax=Tilletiaria anomala (strain ATCC 24038 / CBS 436.72 / UBC 951) TaxID=1037660 RepID=A0A066VDC6_TILAU|nr:uncharacterized protein K437DRAFT_259048 [Tilletiaria anomala UBC 951]KDN39451.1 hypothetical protein K437DRAFT_259048 [Tilletiaria anomala UBC 951]
MASPEGSGSATAATAADTNGHAVGQDAASQHVAQPAGSAATPVAADRNGAASDADDSDDGSDLFGAADDADKKAAGSGEVEDEDDEDEDEVRRVTRKRRAGVESDEDEDSDDDGRPPLKRPSPEPASQSQRTRSRRASTAASSSPPASPRRSRASSVLDAAKEALEYREEDEPYTHGDEQIEENIATLTIPQLPIRRTKEHWVAKLPNFLEFNDTAFDEDEWDPAEAETSGQVRIVDPGLRSLMKTQNTVRWRWSTETRPDGTRIPEGNARIVQWSDGSMSLQVGAELFDIQSHLEANASTPAVDIKGGAMETAVQQSSLGSDPPASSATVRRPAGVNGSATFPSKRMPSHTPEPNRNSTSLSYLVVPHEEAEILTVELPVAGTLSFKASDVNSETHRQLAQAVKHHRVAKVTASDGPDKDPQLLQDEEDRRLKEIERKKQRERKKKEEEQELDAFMGKRRGRYESGGEGLGGSSAYRRSGAAGRAGRPGASRGGSEEYEEDDFVVASPAREKGSGSDDDEDEDHEGDVMDVDDEPDEMEKMEAQIEANEKVRREASKNAVANPGAGPDEDSDDDGEDTAELAAPVKRKRVVESDDDE